MWYSFVEVIQQEKNEIVAQVTTDGRSPWFAGHFPDNPILPGIAQLKMVADIIGASRKDGLRITGLSRVKFRKIVICTAKTCRSGNRKIFAWCSCPDADIARA